MEKVCQDIQEQIPELITGALPPERAAELRQHIRQCPVCSEYLQALQADDKLLRDFTEGMQPTVARLEDKVIETLSSEPSKQPVRFVSMWRTISKSAITRFAAAAVIIIVVLIGVKIFTGRVEQERLEIVRDEDIPSSVFVEHEKPEVAAPREVAITMRKETKPASDAELEAESCRSFLFLAGRITVFIPACFAARIFSFRPPMGKTRPRRVISPVIATSGRVGLPRSKLTSDVNIATPALGPSLGIAPAGTWMW